MKRIFQLFICLSGFVGVLGCCRDDDDATQQADYVKQAEVLYAEQPDIRNCVAGRLTAAEKLKVLVLLNQIRRLHGLADVVYDTAGDEEVMQASLMMAAEGRLSHSPDSSWHCYSAVGARGAGSSNLSGGVQASNLGFQSVEDQIIGWLTDTRNLVADNVGHRRWLISPFLSRIAFGKVAGRVGDNLTNGAAIKVFNFSASASIGRAKQGFVAYPVGDYPGRFFDKNALLSFGVVSDSTNVWNNRNVDFSAATVEVSPRGGTPLSVSGVAFDTQGYGLPNNLQFRVSGLADNTLYDVKIGHVGVAGQWQDYAYWFRIQ